MQFPVPVNVHPLYGLSYSRLRRLKEHYEQHGIYPRTHGNSKKLPSNMLPQIVTENVNFLLTNYIEENAIVLPGRIPGFKRDNVKVLSSSETKMSVWRTYNSVCEASGQQAVNSFGSHNGGFIPGGSYPSFAFPLLSSTCCGLRDDF